MQKVKITKKEVFIVIDMNYKEMYFTLFDTLTKTIELLRQAQIDVENIYIEKMENENNS